MKVPRKGTILKKKFLLVSSLLLTGCFDITGSTTAFIYPDEGIARIRTITNKCPIQVSQAETVPISQLTGWVCIPPDEAAEFRREYEKKECN